MHVLDAYCPHLGANIAIGGFVRGDCIECPFHQWQFSGHDGRCVNIPYSGKGEFRFLPEDSNGRGGGIYVEK